MHLKPAHSLVLAAAGLIALAAAPTANAQSADSLIDKLVDKGILTVEEAQALRDEADKDFTRTLSSKNGMPEWVQALKFNGDFRGRFESIYGDQTGLSDRNRVRYRLRFSVVASLTDSFEVGMRLASGEGNDPISTNQSLTDNGSKKLVNIDQAYARWKALNTEEITGAFTFGKMENPFVYSDMVFDGDYTPEGLAGQLAYRLDDQHTLSFNGGGFSLEEVGGNHFDSWMLGAQARWDALWSPHLQTTAGVGVLAIVDPRSLTDAGVPNINSGNTRTGGVLDHNMNPVVADAAATYTLESFPMYNAPFPIRLAGEFMQNPAAPSDQNTGWAVGVTFGKAGKKGLWEVGYRYKHLEADAWYEEVVDSDFGAFNGGAYRSGTNLKGHIVRASYSPYDFLTLGATWFLTRPIDETPAGNDDVIHRLQLDAALKF